MTHPDMLTRAQWRKSSHSGSGGTGGGDCVEIAGTASAVAVRDSKDPAGPVLAFDRAAFGKLVAHIRGGNLDL